MKKILFTILLCLPLTAMAQSEWELPTSAQDKAELARKAAADAKATAKAAKQAEKEARKAEKAARKAAEQATDKALGEAKTDAQKASVVKASRSQLDPSTPDYKYIKEGSVPEKDGKVVFTLDLDVPALTAQQVYDRTYAALDTIAAEDNQIQSGIILINKKDHNIVAQNREWLTFKSNIIVLDKTQFNYTVMASCTDGHLHLTIERLSYLYEQDRPTAMRTTAEDWISDKAALNKKGTKLLPGSAKFRRRTIDRIEQLFDTVKRLVAGA